MLMRWTVEFRGIQKRHHGHDDQSHASRPCGEARFVRVFNDLVGEKCMLRHTWDERQSGCSAKAVSQGDFDNKNVFGSSVALITYIIIILWYFDAASWSFLNQRSNPWLRAICFVHTSGWGSQLSAPARFIKPSWPCRNPCENQFFLPLLSGSVFLAV